MNVPGSGVTATYGTIDDSGRVVFYSDTGREVIKITVEK